MDNPPLRAGQSRQPVPGEENVLRFLKKRTSDGKVSPDEFELSSQDKQSTLQAISVWAERLTSPNQAREFMGEKKDGYSLFCLLPVERVRALRPDPEATEVAPLNVVWDPLTILKEGIESPDLRPGAEGHAGITGLLRPPGLPKLYFFSLRSQLADLANATLKNIQES